MRLVVGNFCLYWLDLYGPVGYFLKALCHPSLSVLSKQQKPTAQSNDKPSAIASILIRQMANVNLKFSRMKETREYPRKKSLTSVMEDEMTKLQVIRAE